MPFSEFDLIDTYFSGLTDKRGDVMLGIGDDAAVLQPPEGQELVVTTDTLVSGRHFSPDVDPERLGHKVLAVNLSDLASMGAEPAWATLALTLPQVDEAWLQSFSRGFASLARKHGVQLVGGDTTRGPLSISIQLMGFVPSGEAMRRAGAQAGDLIYVTGTVGDAGLALKGVSSGVHPAAASELQKRLECPTPRVEEGKSLRHHANAAIDISDGLVADLQHICDASGVGAILNYVDIPLSPPLEIYLNEGGDWRLPLSAGDDYELCLTVSPDKADIVERIADDFDCDFTRIGVITPSMGMNILMKDGRTEHGPVPGYDHFADE